MLQKLKVTICAFILCLFGLTLMTVSPVKAEDVPDKARDFQSELQLCDRTLEELLVGEEAIRQSLAVLEGENVTCVAESRTLTEQLAAANAKAETLTNQLSNQTAENEANTNSTNDSLARLETLNESLTERYEAIEGRFSVETSSLEAAVARTGELEEQISVASSTEQTLNERIADLEDRLTVRTVMWRAASDRLIELEDSIPVGVSTGDSLTLPPNVIQQLDRIEATINSIFGEDRSVPGGPTYNILDQLDHIDGLVSATASGNTRWQSDIYTRDHPR
jgi:predicted  nucleic acid-binding Zn-ribbon protein